MYLEIFNFNIQLNINKLKNNYHNLNLKTIAMGKQLLQMYEEAKKVGGFGAQVRLAILTKMPSSKSQEAPDSEENIAKFKEAMEIIYKEYKQSQLI